MIPPFSGSSDALRSIVLTIVALVCFAGNSVLCRLALAEGAADPIGFTLIRLLSGAFTLAFILLVLGKITRTSAKGSWFGGLSLFIYAALFSIAYVSLDTATGALILFGSVQISILIFAIIRDGRLSKHEFSGMLLSSLGLGVLLWPQVNTPGFFAALLMSISGIAWACYTIIGQGSKDALSNTAFNFIRTLPFVAVLVLVRFNSIYLTETGFLLAVASGVITSGLGYAIWYAVLPRLSKIQAGVSQLSVPALAALGGVVFAGELLSPRLIWSSVLILGGILLVLVFRPVKQSAH